jgi:phospholipid transport system substrate-binding protein
MKKAFVTSLILVLLLPVPAFAGAPMQTVEKHVNQFLEILKDASLEGDEFKEERRQRLWEVATELFDFTALSMRSLGSPWRQMSDAQKKEFRDLFSKLLERAYMEKIEEYEDEKVVFEEETSLGEGKAEVRTKVVTDSKEIPLTYRLYETGGDWKVYDLLIENVSMVKNYRTQFREYLSGHSIEELIEHLRKKTSKSD